MKSFIDFTQYCMTSKSDRLISRFPSGSFLFFFPCDCLRAHHLLLALGVVLEHGEEAPALEGAPGAGLELHQCRLADPALCGALRRRVHLVHHLLDLRVGQQAAPGTGGGGGGPEPLLGQRGGQVLEVAGGEKRAQGVNKGLIYSKLSLFRI